MSPSLSNSSLPGNPSLLQYGNQTNQYKDGGAGSGGRVKLVRFDWGNKTFYQGQKSTFSYDTFGGLSNMKDGRNGSAWSTPCPPGYSDGLNCDRCPTGYYSSNMFQNTCSKCNNLPSNETAAYFNSSEPSTTSNCDYNCSSGITKRELNHNCYETFDLFINQVGGMEMFIIIIVSIVLMIIIMMIYFLTQSKSKSTSQMIKQVDRAIQNNRGISDIITSNDDDKYRESMSHVNFLLMSKNLKFFERDIYQHICRIYLVGNNYVSEPWRICINPPISLRNRIVLDKYV